MTQPVHLELHYMSGAGNLFTVLDNRAAILDNTTASRLAPQLCNASATLGKHTEGLMLIALPTENIDTNKLNFTVEFFNPDGSSSMMCGNGSRCAVRFAQHIGIIPVDDSVVRFRMAGAEYSAVSGKGDIPVTFPPPLAIQEHHVISIDEIPFDVSYLNVGSDHAVVEEGYVQKQYAEHGKHYDFHSFAPALRNHTAFPRGANANVYRINNGMVYLTTFERGVEAITGACGTGAIATALTVWLKKQLPHNIITIIPPSGEALHITINATQETQVVTSVILSGGATFIGNTIFPLSA